LGNDRILAKFIALNLVRLVPEQAVDVQAPDPAGMQMLNRPAGNTRIHLESAALMRHINAVTLRIIRSLRAACSDPVLRFLACPFS
jgi:hypothetical protein